MATPDAAFLIAIRNNQILVRLVVTLAVLCVVLVIGIISLFPLKEKEFVLYEMVNGGNNFVKVQRANAELKAAPALISFFLRRYVVSREPMNKVDEQDRYAVVRAMSSDRMWTVFKAQYVGKESPLFREGFKRSVTITRDSAIDVGVHQVEFVTVDKIDGQPGETRSEWVANIAYEFQDQNVSYDDLTMNPTGMVITEYTLTRRSNVQ